MDPLVFTICVNITIVFTTVFCLIYGYYKHCHGYWARRNLPYIPGKFPFGSITSVILKKQSFPEKIQEFYQTMKSQGHKYAGLYFFTRKALLIIDPELVKKVLSTDFQYFPDRGIYYDEENDPLSAHMVALSGPKWKELRQKLSPTFSSGKLKVMFHTVSKCAEQLNKVVDEWDKNKPIEMKDLLARYTTDVIGSCAFGIESNSLKNPEAEFREIGRRVFKQSRFDIVKRLIVRNSPWLAKKLKIKVINPEVSTFFLSVVKETVEYRRKENISRGDFLQLLIELMDKERKDDDNKMAAAGGAGGGLTLNQAAAHSFVFFLAGFETSASTITFALYELTRHIHVQDELRKEVFRILGKHGNTITYEGIMEMVYMDKILYETMRRYPTFVILMRKCTRDYLLPGSNVPLEKGTPVIVPVHALHHDPDFYPDPEEFNPERFQSDMIKNTVDHTYLPFGSGPRICIGLRFAMIQMKIAIAVLMLNYKFTLNDKTSVPLKMNPASFILTPLDGTWLNVTKLAEEDIKRLQVTNEPM